VKVTPLDIRRKEFKRSMRGYSDEEVDIFLDEVADEFERLFQENIELHDRVQRLEEQIAGHAQMRDALEKTLISAQLQADEMKANARKEGELILRDAELKARQVVNDSYGETQRVQQTLTQLKHLEEDFRFKFRSLLEGHLKLLSEAAIGEPEAATRAGEDSPVAAALASVDVATPGPETLGPTQRVPDDGETGDAAPAGESLGVGRTSPATDDDTPTEETMVTPEAPAAEQPGKGELDAAELVAELAGFSGVAPGEGVENAADSGSEAPAPASEGAGEEEPPASGFFFGRRLDDDDAFPPPETDKKGKGRDFEW